MISVTSLRSPNQKVRASFKARLMGHMALIFTHYITGANKTPIVPHHVS